MMYLLITKTDIQSVGLMTEEKSILHIHKTQQTQMGSDSEGGRFWALAGWGFPRAVTGSTIYVLVLFWRWVTSPSAQVLLIYMGRIQPLCEKNQTLNGQVTLWDAGSPEQPVSGTASIPQQGLALPNVYTPQSNPGYPRQCVSGALSWSPAYGPLPNEQLPSLSPLSSRPLPRTFSDLPIIWGLPSFKPQLVSFHLPLATLPQPPSSQW